MPILQKYIDKNNITTFIDCFCGGANIVDKIKCENRIASDYNEDLIVLLKYIQRDKDLSIAPTECTFEHYSDVRADKEHKFYSQEYRALIGYCASYGGRYYDGGFARNSRKDDRNSSTIKYRNNINNLKEQAPNLKGIEFSCRDYKNYLHMDIKNALFYLDPPYKGTKQYSKQNIDYEEFYNFCRELSKENIVVISEYNMPDDFVCIWEKERKVQQKSDREKADNVTEKLFTYRQ